MNSYFTAFVNLPTIITEPGKYRTRSGEIVNIVESSTRHVFGCMGTYPEGIEDRWHKTGRLYAHTLSPNDIIAKV